MNEINFYDFCDFIFPFVITHVAQTCNLRENGTWNEFTSPRTGSVDDSNFITSRLKWEEEKFRNE